MPMDQYQELRVSCEASIADIQISKGRIATGNNNQIYHDTRAEALERLFLTATTLKAQSTKLSLLLINRPYSPNEISGILEGVRTSVHTNLTEVSLFCTSSRFGECFLKVLRREVGDLWQSLDACYRQVPVSHAQLNDLSKQAVLSTTGVIWSTCTRLNELAESGVAQCAKAAFKDSVALVGDAIEELNAWDPDAESDDQSDFSFDLETDLATDAAKGEGEKSQQSGKSDMEMNIEDRLSTLNLDKAGFQTELLSKLKSIKLLLNALMKRRVSTIPNITRSTSEEVTPDQGQLEGLDNLITFAQAVSEMIDNLVGNLYEGALGIARQDLVILIAKARGCKNRFRLDWNGKEDHFSIWSDEWEQRLGQQASHPDKD